MRSLTAVVLFFIPALALAEIPQTFNNMTFGQPPEADMICTRGPCSTNSIRPDVKQNKIEMSYYVRPDDITTYGNWEISTPRYMFYKDKFFKVVFNIICDYADYQRCIDETVEKLSQEYELETLSDVSTEDEDFAVQYRSYSVGNDTNVSITQITKDGNGRQPSVLIQSKSLLAAAQREVREGHQ